MMNRRDILRLAASLTAISLTPPLAAWAETAVYQPDVLKADLAAGKTVVLDFYADWCPTCRAQARAMDTIKAGDPAYDTALTFMVVDWDTWKGGDLTTALNVPERSTLVVLKGQGEVGRLYAETDPAAIKALLDQALKAAQS
jgi:hypothetical protein